jgi:hypothetical protein
VLPPGIHVASLEAIRARFATNEKRRELFDGFNAVVINLRSAGCKSIYLDGSFVTDKTLPGDFDGCWDPMGVDLKKVDSVLLDFTHARAAQKRKFRGEMLLAMPGPASATILDFFQTDRATGSRKGTLLVQQQT